MLLAPTAKCCLFLALADFRFVISVSKVYAGGSADIRYESLVEVGV